MGRGGRRYGGIEEYKGQEEADIDDNDGAGSRRERGSGAEQGGHE